MPQSKRPPPSTSTSSSKSKQQSASKRSHKDPPIKQSQIKKKDDETRSKINPLLLRQFDSILSIFRDTFSHLFTPALPSLIQDVKQSLYLRDYVAAFGSLEKLQAYAARWSVARALAYFDMISCEWWSKEVTQMFSRSREKLDITCIGGGAGAELVAIAAAFAFDISTLSQPSAVSQGDSHQLQESGDTSTSTSMPRILHLNLLDFAAWTPISDSLYSTITNLDRNPKLNLSETAFTVNCHQQDVLSPLSDTTISSLASSDIVTILFTAGELYSQSPASTTKFFMSLHALTKPGAILVVVDSAGGFEDLDVLKKDSTSQDSGSFGGYKLGFLLDKTLTNRERWQPLVGEDSRWWRVPQELKDENYYPLALENMRCLIRVYRRTEN
ncbi:hypothetical protein ABW19_dt0204485 [Dactylella cylindrospora]|nr:hypothetical protein ABW19_dt0204485 [Dactylella cylindrospora]